MNALYTVGGGEGKALSEGEGEGERERKRERIAYLATVQTLFNPA